MKKLTLLLVLFFVQIIYSQQANTYHVVANGETLSTIAQKYKVTPYDIIKLNPNAVNGIKEKEVLIIPKSLVETSVAPSVIKSTPTSNFSVSSDKNQSVLTHIVQSKETKFGLSKIYGISIQELEAQNPQILAGLQVGHKLQVKGATTSFKQDLTQLPVVTTFSSKYDYVVLPGETLYGISKRNGITVDELIKANASVLNGILKSGQKLSIPVRKESTNLSNSNNSKYHLVEPKETKFGLSKKYGVTIEQLETLNPQIIKGLQIGQKLTIPTSYTGTDFVSDKVETTKVIENKVEDNQTTPKLSQEYVDYEIQPKETLFGLSKKAGMTIKDFVELNPKLEASVQIGMVIKMPKNAANSSVISTEIVPKETTKIVPEKVKPVEVVPNNNVVSSNSKYKDLRSTINKSIKSKVTIVLPFSDAKYKEYLAKSSEFKGVEDDFLKMNLELYTGALKAIDSAKTLGLNIDVATIELQNNSTPVAIETFNTNKDVIESNAIIMPYYDSQAETIASVLSDKKTPVITSQVSNNEKGYSNLYVSVPSETTIRSSILDYIKSKSATIIVVNSLNRIQSKDFISESCPESKFVKVSDRNVVDTDDLKKLLSKGKLNYVILDADKSSMIISSTNVLLNELSEYQIQIVVLDNSLLKNYTNVSSIRMNLLKMIYPSFNSIEKATIMKATEQKVFQINSDELSQNFLFGFDFTLDTLLRLAQDKKFEASVNEDVTECVKLKFEYKKDRFGTNLNQGFYMLQHDTDGKIKVLNE